MQVRPRIWSIGDLKSFFFFKVNVYSLQKWHLRHSAVNHTPVFLPSKVEGVTKRPPAALPGRQLWLSWQQLLKRVKRKSPQWESTRLRSSVI